MNGYVIIGVLVALVLAALWATGGLPFVDAAMRGSTARKVARSLGTEVAQAEEQIWGGKTATAYYVRWRHAGAGAALALDVSGTIATLQLPGGNGPTLELVTFDSGELAVRKGAGTLAESAFLDAQVRASLERIERIGTRRALSVDVSTQGVRIYKHTHFSAKKTLLFLELCRPVFDRALEISRAAGPGTPAGSDS